MARETGKSKALTSAGQGVGGEDDRARRRARSAEALRENLKRRKAQARERAAAQRGDPAGSAGRS